MEAAFFDLDKTVIAKASIVAFGRPFYKEGLISKTTVLRALYTQLIFMQLGASEQKIARIRESVLALTKGWEQSKVKQIVKETLTEIVEPIIFEEALELLEQHRQAGRKIYIVSASPQELVNPLGEYLKVDGSIASRAKIDDKGHYLGSMEFYAYGPYKAQAMREIAERENIDLSASYAYSDSYTDLPLLEAVGHPVVVNPDRVLLRLAKEKNWEIRNFVKPVRLSQRSKPVHKNPLAILILALAGLGTAILIASKPARKMLTKKRRY